LEAATRLEEFSENVPMYTRAAMKTLSILSIAAALVWLTLSADVRSQTGQVPLPDGPGRDLVMVTCGE
jgi:hypothetical protein